MKAIILACAFAFIACKKPQPANIGPTVQPFGLVKGVTLGMTVADVQRVAPDLHRQDNSTDINEIYAGYREPGENYHVHFDHQRAHSIRIELSKRPLADLTAAWGPPTKELAVEKIERELLYITAGQRATVHVSDANLEVSFQPYVPLATTLDGLDSVLGKSLTDAVATLTAQKGVYLVDPPTKQNAALRLPTNEFGYDTATTVLLKAGADGIITSWQIQALLQREALDSARAEIRAVYEHKWGPPTKHDESVTTYGTSVRVNNQYMGVEVGAP